MARGGVPCEVLGWQGGVPYEGLGWHGGRPLRGAGMARGPSPTRGWDGTGGVPYGSCRDNPLWLSAALLPSPLGRDFHPDIVGRLGPVEFLARGLEIER